MLQTWILLQDHAPKQAHKNGLNKSVCGIVHTLGIINETLVMSSGFRLRYKFGSHTKIIDMIILKSLT